jgi:hypothetical protein
MEIAYRRKEAWRGEPHAAGDSRSSGLSKAESPGNSGAAIRVLYRSATHRASERRSPSQEGLAAVLRVVEREQERRTHSTNGWCQVKLQIKIRCAPGPWRNATDRRRDWAVASWTPPSPPRIRRFEADWLRAAAPPGKFPAVGRPATPIVGARGSVPRNEAGRRQRCQRPGYLGGQGVGAPSGCRQDRLVTLWDKKRKKASGPLRRVESLQEWRRSGVLMHLPGVTRANEK